MSLGSFGLGSESAPNPRSALGSILGSFFDSSGDLWSSIGTQGSEDMWFGQQDLQRLCECDENGKNRIP